MSEKSKNWNIEVENNNFGMGLREGIGGGISASDFDSSYV